DRLAQVDAEFEAVRAVERGDLADALRTEPGAGTIGGAAVERGAEHGDVVGTAGAHILDVGRLEEGVDPGEVRQFAAREGGNPLVHDGIGALEAEFQPAREFFVPFGGRQVRFGLDRVAGFRTVMLVILAQQSLHGWRATAAGSQALAFLPGFYPAVERAAITRLHLSDQAPRVATEP